MTPVEPPKKAIGRKIAANTSPIPIKAPIICFIDFLVASFGGKPSSCIILSTFSITTIASSTSNPIASTIANIVNILMDISANLKTAKVPSRTTGTAIVGISVARIFPRKTNITRNTRIIAIKRVLNTSLIATETNGAVS
ncbi:MAG: hypothetical protein BWX89_00046 [candidate division TA06 bacterium ADurb.Bin131]|uniref:Uncharacterized protein n=1 Tax=candidate division TA06 bacterium ADurb.Bin131 TaxID=1852827 RepID=A0A1V6CEP3_UNCT6|nr:MAG: hypothetical protein BWX89_00046 [candidate division TA06 bacterium ADurb.Bin131]